MTPRIDGASRTIRASPTEVYRAFAEPGALERWIPPAGMSAAMLHFDFREGGSYRMRLTYGDAGEAQGKTGDDFDEVQVRLLHVSEGRRIEQEIVFESDDPAFAGTMRMVWTFEADGEGTLVAVRAENVPGGIRQEDHETAMRSTLENLDAFLAVPPRVGLPILYILSGLPGTGKTTLAKRLAEARGAAYLRIDTLEQGLRDVCAMDVEEEGYLLAHRLASDNLRLGISVVADSCNPIELTRREWERVASDAGSEYVNIEIVCSDADEHRRRVESRTPSITGLRLPTWPDVENREYARWEGSRIVIDTAGREEDACFHELLSRLPSPTR